MKAPHLETPLWVYPVLLAAVVVGGTTAAQFLKVAYHLVTHQAHH